MKASYHIFVLFISIIGFSLSGQIPFVEVGVIISIIYFYAIVRELKSVKNGFLLPSFFLTFFLMFEVIWGIIPMKYNWFMMQTLNTNRGAIDDTVLNKCAFVSLIGISSMWISFITLYRRYFKRQHYSLSSISVNRCLRRASMPLSVVLVLLLAYFVRSGMFGYFGDSAVTNYTDKIYYFALLIPSFYFLYSEDGRHKRFYGTILIIVALLGLLSGAKALMIIPLTIIFLIRYIKTGALVNRTLIYVFVAIIVSFILIIPIRDAIFNDTSLSQSNATELISQATEGSSMTTYMLATTLSRINYVTVLSNALEYNGPLHQNVEHLWEYSLMSPLYAFIPRTLLPDKPTSTFANWYAYAVCGSTEDNNMSASYPGILYLAGGIPSVILGFLLVGIVLFFVVKIWLSDEYMYIYLSQFMRFAILPAEPWILFVTLIQNIVLFYFYHKLISRRL